MGAGVRISRATVTAATASHEARMPVEGSVMKLRTSFLIVAVFAVASACGGQAPAVTTGPGITQAPGATPAPQQTQQPAGPTAAPPVGGSGSTIHVVVASGPQAGTYDQSGTKVDCNTSAGGSGATYLDMTRTDGVGSLTFSSGEGGATPAKFYFQVLFGSPTAFDAPELKISTLDPTHADGTGTASLQDNTSTIKWTIDGTTADGVDVTATVECGPVDRN